MTVKDGAVYLQKKPKMKLSKAVIHLEETLGLKRAQIVQAILAASKKGEKDKKVEKGKKVAPKQKVGGNVKTTPAKQKKPTPETLIAAIGELMAQISELQARLDGEAAPNKLDSNVDRCIARTPPIHLSCL
jgi:hypothetical protein